ncbi:MAG: deoxyguanosinetriphosphate triphosphohydrolase [Christensenellaceae bacterium]|jgi:dGTPase|nr:deoxyguanosinetriphosphate triphosphohydrolase [Christensenellaceae bacterium]
MERHSELQVNERIKADYLDYEDKFLSPHATRSSKSLGRQNFLSPCPLRTEFQRDRDRILHCKSFRRLKHKTQVFLSPNGDHYRTRLTHTLEVTQIARTLSRALRLNEDLTEAIALGHDLGHTPFGHAGEKVLNKLTGHFRHNEQSLRVVEKLENEGKGLNLTFEVRDGILNHCLSTTPNTLEGMVVNFSDRIAYINHDIDDAIRAGVIKESDLPQNIIELLGNKRGNMIDKFVSDIVNMSYGNDKVVQSDLYRDALMQLRKFMFDRVYFSESEAKTEEIKADRLIEALYNYFLINPHEVPDVYKIHAKDTAIFITDYIAGMSDTFAIKTFSDHFLPHAWEGV